MSWYHWGLIPKRGNNASTQLVAIAHLARQFVLAKRRTLPHVVRGQWDDARWSAFDNRAPAPLPPGRNQYARPRSMRFARSPAGGGRRPRKGKKRQLGPPQRNSAAKVVLVAKTRLPKRISISRPTLACLKQASAPYGTTLQPESVLQNT